MLAQNQISIFSKFSRNLNSCRNFWKMPNLVESLENLDFFSKFLKIAIFVIISEKSRFGSEFSKNLYLSILVEIFEKSRFWSKFPGNHDLGPNVGKSPFGSKFWKKNPYFGQNCRENSILLEISEKYQFWWKFTKNPELGKKFRKSRFLTKSFINRDFRRNFRKISIVVDFVLNSRFSPNFENNVEFHRKISKNH